MDDLKLFEQFVNSKLDINLIKNELKINELALKEALKTGHFETICNLKNQRDELKNTLIDLLEQNQAA